jgi:hypothetical protein
MGALRAISEERREDNAEGLVLVHVGEHLLHGRAADGLGEELGLQLVRRHEAQQWEQQQQPPEAGRCAAMCRARV